MELRGPRLLFASLLGFSACTGDGQDQPISATEQAIVAGMADPGDSAMVEFIALLPNDMAGTCTATLISPHVLLTAAHCIVETTGARYGVYLGADDSGLNSKTFIPLASVAYDPQYDNNHPDAGHDFGVGILSTALTITPVPLNHLALGADLVGKSARYIGYGLSNGVQQTGSGTRRQAIEPIAQVTDHLIRIAPNPNATCEGDSGGPLLIDMLGQEVLAGVVSFGDDAQCLKSSYFQRVDSQAGWIDMQVATYDPGSAPAATPPTGTTSGTSSGTTGTTSTGGTAGVGDSGAITRPVPPQDSTASQAQVPSHPSSGGCSYGQGSGSSLSMLTVALAGLLGRRRRR
jgi:V8-like Glu-specific endopeptidase